MELQVGDQVKQSRKEVNLTSNQFQLKVYLEDDTAKFQIQDINNMQFFSLDLTPTLLEQLPLTHYFEKPIDVIQFLINTTSKFNITNQGVIQMEIELPNKKIKKIIFQTIQKSVEKNQLLLIKINRMEKEIKLQSKEIGKQKLQIKDLRDELTKSNQYCAVLNRNLCKMKKSIDELNSCRFIIDSNNSHCSEYSVFGKRVKFLSKSADWRNIFGQQIAEKSIYSFKVLQFLCQAGAIMYGIGCDSIRGVIDANVQEKSQSISYYSGGAIYSGGRQQTSTQRQVGNGQVIETIVDLMNWKVIWRINDKQIGSSNISETMKLKPIYPVVFIRLENSQIEFI